jgi:hypothetical protein
VRAFAAAWPDRMTLPIRSCARFLIQRLLLELGTGFAFGGRQVLLEVGDQAFTSTCSSTL